MVRYKKYRYKRKIFYQLEVPGKWWNYSKKEWVDDPRPGSSNMRTIQTAVKAFKELSKCPSGGELYRMIRKRTGWNSEMWTKD